MSDNKPTTKDFLKEAAKDEPKAKVFDTEGTCYWPKTPQDLIDGVPEGYEQDPSDGAYRRVIPS